MAKPTKKAKDVKVLNTTTRMIGCFVPGIKNHPPRQVTFMSGNNTVSASDWELCMQNKVFERNTKPQDVVDRVGKKIRVTALKVGSFDKDQESVEIDFDKELDKARQELSA